MSSDNLVILEKFLGSGMKWKTSEPDSPKIVNASESSLKTALNNLCKPLPIFWIGNDAPFYSDCLCLTRSIIL